MDYLHQEFDLDADDVVEVKLDHWANVRLLDDANFAQYQRGGQHTYHGGLATQQILSITAPHSGHWHLVVDLGGHAGSVNPAVRVLHHA